MIQMLYFPVLEVLFVFLFRVFHISSEMPNLFNHYIHLLLQFLKIYVY